MARRELSESGFYHITTRSAGQIALFEDDDDRRFYLRFLRDARDESKARILAWVLMTDHVHIVADFGDSPGSVSDFMGSIDLRYAKYFNAKTKRSGTLFQGRFWSKPVLDDAQLVATVHYVHMNPEAAGLAPMRDYRWSSYREYAGTLWVVDTRLIFGLFGSFEAFDAYAGSPKDVVCEASENLLQDEDVLAFAIELAQVETSSELRSLPAERRNEVIRLMGEQGVSARKAARAFGIGASTAARIMRS